VDSGFIPPDSNGAVGPDHFVELINGRYSVYRKTDGVRVQTSTLNQFWSDASVPPQVNRGAFDPRIVFDHASKRWFASSGQRTSNVLLGVSKSSDPTAGWTGFSIDLPVKGVFSDFPKLDVDADGVYLNVVPINSGFMGPGDFPNEILISVPKKDLVSPMPTVAKKTVFVTDFESGNARFQPAVDFGPSDGQAALLGAPRIFPAIDKLNRTNVLNAAGPGPASLSATADITVPLLVSPPQTAVQPDGSSDLETTNTLIN